MRVTGIGSLPGTDMAASLRMVLGTVSSPWLPELPARGIGADIIGRTGAILAAMPVDLQPQGWRMGVTSGIDQARARSWLRNDLDELEEAVQNHEGTMRITVCGPWTMAACLERPRGDKVLADHGARRELTESLAAGLLDLVSEIGRRMPQLQLEVQLDEPMLPAVMQAKVPTASGFSKHRRVDLPEATELLARVVQPLVGREHRVTLHCCAGDIPHELLMPGGLAERCGVQALALDADHLGARQWDELGPWLESGRGLVLGVAPSARRDEVSSTDRIVTRVLRIAQTLALDPQRWIDQVELSPACGLASWTTGAAGRQFEQLQSAAELIPEQLLRRG